MTRASTRRDPPAPRAVRLDTLPGHCIRRLQQIAVAVFMQEAGSASVTPVQFAVLQVLGQQPGVDQRTLARLVSLDTSTIGGVVDRLEARGLLTRSLSPTDRRVRLLALTPAGAAMLDALTPSMLRAQDRMLDPLPAADRQAFLRMVQAVIANHEALDDGAVPDA